MLKKIYKDLQNLLENLINPSVVRVVVCSGFLLLAYAAFNFQKILKKSDITDNLDNYNYNNKFSNQQQANETVKTLQQEININNKNASEQVEMVDNLCKQLQLLRLELNKIQDQVTGISSSINNLKGVTLNFSKTKPNNILNSKNLQLVDHLKKLPQIDSLMNYEKQLLKVNKNFYVLQIMSSKNEQSIRNLINQYDPFCGNKIKYASGNFTPGKERWYIAWYGVYANRQAALKDLINLPKGLQKLHPIVRDYATVHKVINSKKDLS